MHGHIQPRRINGWDFFNDNVSVCDVVQPGGIESLNPDDRRVAEWFATGLAGCQHVIDLGCGAGFPGLFVAAHVGELVGVDAAPKMLNAARWHATELGVKNASFEMGGDSGLRYEDGWFDGAMLCGLLESMDSESVDRVLPELWRILAPGARLAALDQDWDDVLGRKPREEKTIRGGDGRLVLCHVERTGNTERDTRYMVNPSGRSGGRLMRELAGNRRVSTNTCPNDLDPEDMVDAWYEESAQFNENRA